MNILQYLNEKPLLFAFCLMFLSLIYLGCNGTATSSEERNLEGYWQLRHLEGKEITVLEQDEKGIFVGTETGLFQLKETELVPLGLENHEIIGAVRLKDGSILASVQASNFSTGDTTLFKTSNEGETWKPFMNNFGGKEGRYTWIEVGPVAASPPSDTLFIGGGGQNIIYSLNGGQDWKSVRKWDSWGGYGGLLYIDPWHEGRIWVGGISPLSEVLLTKLNDYRKGWNEWIDVKEGLSPNIEAVAFEIITHRDNPDLVLAGLGGGVAQANNVKKSTDGGQIWHNTVLEKIGVHAFARSVIHPNIIYASGRDASGKVHFAATTNFGETWDKEIFEEGPSPVTTNDLAVMMIDGKEVLFFGTDHGLYSYAFK